jgi:excisionase family DNA binding protein
MPEQPHQPPQHTGLFVRIPREQATRLDRASAAAAVPKKDLIAGLVAQHVDPDTPHGIEALRQIAHAGGRRIVIEGEERHVQPGFGFFSPTPQLEVLDADGAAELLRVERETVLGLAEAGDLPGRSLDGEWRFSRQALLDWLGGGAS